MFLSFEYLIFMLPAFLIVMLAQWYVNSTYRKWSQVQNYMGISGSEAARRLLQFGGIPGVEVEQTPGQLSDHYDPRKKILRLSPGVAQGQSVASVAIAAHEIGHAVQDKVNYGPLRLRAALVPAVSVSSSLGWILILVGLILRSALGTQIAWIGVAVFALGAIFALATLPVELNASARAQRLLVESGLVHTQAEQEGVQAVLRAAAWTYVAGLAAAILQLLYYVMLVGGGRRRR
jgi:Zn-dependent membrane protease YugP